MRHPADLTGAIRGEALPLYKWITPRNKGTASTVYHRGNCISRPRGFWLKYLALILLSAGWFLHAQEYTRGIGIYPGDPKEYTGPSLVIDAKTYRNLALHRPAYQSSAYDYNLTAQLVTDGIRSQALPQWLVASTSDAGVLNKIQREVFLDGNVTSSIEVSGANPWVEFDLEGGGEPPEVDHVELYLRRISNPPAGGWTYIVSGSDDHVTWKELGRANGADWPSMKFNGPSFGQSIAFAAPSRSRSYRVQ